MFSMSILIIIHVILKVHAITKIIQFIIHYGKCLVELCCVHDIHLLNGRLHDDFSGNFTCTANNGKSVVDYHIASSEMFPFITYFTVVDKDESDHFPTQSRLSFSVQREVIQIHCEKERVELFPLDRFQ